jgi:hypothetical protein
MSMWRRIRSIFRPVLSEQEALEAVLSSPEYKDGYGHMYVMDGLFSYKVTNMMRPSAIFEVSKYDGSVRMVFPRKPGAM